MCSIAISDQQVEKLPVERFDASNAPKSYSDAENRGGIKAEFDASIMPPCLRNCCISRLPSPAGSARGLPSLGGGYYGDTSDNSFD
jgi:hypothetical protein